MSLGCDWQISMHFPCFFFSGLLVVVVMIAKRNIVIKGSGVTERHSKVYFKVPTNTYLTWHKWEKEMAICTERSMILQVNHLAQGVHCDFFP